MRSFMSSPTDDPASYRSDGNVANEVLALGWVVDRIPRSVRTTVSSPWETMNKAAGDTGS